MLKMQLTANWADGLKHEWSNRVVPLIPSESNILEIGSYEGNSTCFWIENIKPKKMICIDTFKPVNTQDHDTIFSNFNNNTRAYQESNLLDVKIGTSHEIMPTLDRETFDFIYIDGSHVGKDVIEDAILANKLIKRGGHILFDDYYGGNESREPMVYNNPVDYAKFAIDAFVTLFSNEYRTVCKPGNYQLLLKKL